MKRIALTLIGAAAFAVMGCSSEPNDRLNGGGGSVATDPNSAAGGAENTYHHDGVFGNPGGANGITGGGSADTPQTTDPVSAARYHGCTKITYGALGAILSSRGAKLTGPQNALTLYKGSSAALGVANYSGRVPEALIGSTSAMAKQFDIFLAAAPEVVANAGTLPACQGAQIADASGKFTKDGVSCLLGTLATDEHVTVANQAVADAVKGGATQAQGVQIAAAAMMEAAHTCE